MPSLTPLAVLTAIMTVLPAVQAHMALFHPSVYGFDDGQLSYPLADRGFNDWWFHGHRSDNPSETMSIPAGQTLNVEIACGKHVTTYGGGHGNDACPNDAGSFHAGGSTGSGSGWGGNDESNLMGCALAIAYKSNVWDVQPEDFIVMSVQERCVRQRDTPFEIPTNLPSCPPGGCICSWFWEGKNSAPEMYMTGFKCDVTGGRSVSSYPRPAEPRRGNTISGPTQPMYWANDVNNIGYSPGYENRPSYNSQFGWQNGAQTSAFDGVAGGGGGGGGGGSSTTSSAAWGEEPSSSTRTRTRTSSESPRPTDWYNHVADPTVSASSANASPTNGTGGKCRKRSKRAIERAKRSLEKKDKQTLEDKMEERSHRHRRASHGNNH